jgi:selenocysteine lyase/cysteine desulfurase
LQASDWMRLAAQVSDIAWELANSVAAWTGLPLLASRRFCVPQMVALPRPPCDTAELKAFLWDRRVEVTCYLWQVYPILRVSVQPYNNINESERFLQALRAYC